MPTRRQTPSGRVMVARLARSAAQYQLCLRMAKNAANSRSTNSGSEPPRKERCHQAKLRIEKERATHPPQRRCANMRAPREHAAEISRMAISTEMPVNFEITAMRYGKPQKCLTKIPEKFHVRIASAICRYAVVSPKSRARRMYGRKWEAVPMKTTAAVAQIRIASRRLGSRFQIFAEF